MPRHDHLYRALHGRGGVCKVRFAGCGFQKKICTSAAAGQSLIQKAKGKNEKMYE